MVSGGDFTEMIIGKRELDMTKVGKPTHRYHYLYAVGLGADWPPNSGYYPEESPAIEILWGLPIYPVYDVLEWDFDSK